MDCFGVAGLLDWKSPAEKDREVVGTQVVTVSWDVLGLEVADFHICSSVDLAYHNSWNYAYIPGQSDKFTRPGDRKQILASARPGPLLDRQPVYRWSLLSGHYSLLNEYNEIQQVSSVGLPRARVKYKRSDALVMPSMHRHFLPAGQRSHSVTPEGSKQWELRGELWRRADNSLVSSRCGE